MGSSTTRPEEAVGRTDAARLALLRSVLNRDGFLERGKWVDLTDAEWLETIRVHRLTARALGMLMAEGPEAISRPNVKSELQKEYAEITASHVRRLFALKRFAELFGASKLPLILLKGNGASFVCNDPFSLREVSDLDILVEEPSEFRRELEQVGHRDAWMAASHEEMNIIFDGVKIDLHKSFPIYNTLNDAPVDLDCTSGSMPRIVHFGNLKLQYINEDFVRDSTQPFLSATGAEIRCPNPTMALFIRINHIYTDFVRQYTTICRFRPPVRLIEIADVMDLAEHPSIDWHRLNLMVERFSLQQEVAVVGRLVHQASGCVAIARKLGASAIADDQPDFVGSLFFAFGFQFSVSLDSPQLFLNRLGLEKGVELLRPRQLNFQGSGSASWDASSGDIMQHGDSFKFQVMLEYGAGRLNWIAEFPENKFKNPYVSLTVGPHYFRIFPETAFQIANRLVSSSLESHLINMSSRTVSILLDISINTPTSVSMVIGDVEGATMKSGIFIPARITAS